MAKLKTSNGEYVQRKSHQKRKLNRKRAKKDIGSLSQQNLKVSILTNKGLTYIGKIDTIDNEGYFIVYGIGAKNKMYDNGRCVVFKIKALTIQDNPNVVIEREKKNGLSA